MVLILIRHTLIALGVFARVILSPLRKLYQNGVYLCTHILDARKTTQMEKLRSSSMAFNGADCPYEYILGVYGRNHFENIVSNLDPDLKTRDSALFDLVLEIMDAIHFGAILVDDVADNSMLRKGKPAAHLLFGSSETINRAYLRIFEVITKCVRERPSLVPFILENLSHIHKGQDISLVWRRDGFELCLNQSTALSIYKECASLKTGALFRLVGQLVFGSHEKDKVMSEFGWYCHLQNDCKNLYSCDVVSAKGKLAEDLLNKEYSFPIIVALNSSAHIANAVGQALQRKQHFGSFRQKKLHQAALEALQESEVKSRCLGELEELKSKLYQFVGLWGRQEAMTFQPVGSNPRT